MNKINLNLLFIFSSVLFSSFSFSDESIYRIDYIIFKFLPNIDSKEKFKTPEITFSDELINITDLKYPEFISGYFNFKSNKSIKSSRRKH